MSQADVQQTERMERLSELLQEADSIADPVWRTKLQEIVQTLLEFHGEGLARIVAAIEAGGVAGQRMLATLADDDLVGNLFVLYDLHPRSFEERVEAALEEVRPLLARHGGDVELVECMPDASIRLRLKGNCHGCASSQMTLKQTIEESLRAAVPDLTEIDVEGITQPAEMPLSGFVPLSALETVNEFRRVGIAHH